MNCSFLTDDGYVNRKAKETKACVTKRETKFEDCKNCPKSNVKMWKWQQRLRSEACNVFTKKIALSSNDDKRLQTFDVIISIWYKRKWAKQNW